jgi:lysozyme
MEDMDMEVSSRGLLEVCELEGIVIAPYRCSANVLTWGVGHTAAAGGPDPAELDMKHPVNDAEIDAVVLQALRQFKKDAEKYAERVNGAVTVPMKQHEFDALFSFDLNTGGIYRARLTKLLNSGADRADVANAFMGWLKPPEIRGRRKREAKLFMDGDYDSNGDDIPVYTTDGKGNLGKVIRVIDGADLLAMMGKPPATPVKKVVVPEGKNRKRASQTKTVQAQVMQWLSVNGMAAYAAWNSADDITRYAILGGAALASVAGFIIFRDRLKAFADGWR